MYIYLAEFSEWEILQTRFVEQIKTHILCSISFFFLLCHLWDNVEKYGKAKQATDDNIMWHRKYAVCVPDD